MEKHYQYNVVEEKVKIHFTLVICSSFSLFPLPRYTDSVFPINLDDFIESIRLCVCEAKFSFEDEFFEQKFGYSDGKLSFTRV